MNNSVILRLKQALVATAAGRVLESARDNFALWKAMRSLPEQGSRLFQDVCGRRLLYSLCEPNRTFLDVGAHIGSVISNVLRRNPEITVVAIEADPQKADRLKRKFPQIKVHSCAVGDSDGQVEFQLDLTRPGFSSISSSAKTRDNVQTIRVPMRRLDDLYTADKLVGLIKIDVEGMELAVLMGGKRLIARSRPVIYFESGPGGGHAFGFTVEQLFDWFSQNDYQLFVPNRVAHDGTSLHRDGFLESHHYPQRTLNYFAVPSERRLSIRDRARAVLGVLVAKK
jgi:FkbM family methyltransferase